MTLSNKPFYFAVFFLLFTSLMAACSTSPEEKKTAHYQKGMEYINAGEHRFAAVEFRNAVEIDPRFAEARYQLGLAYLKTERPGEALRELERAASLDPSNTDALLKTAEIYLLAGQPDNSLESIRKILETNRDFPDAYAVLAQAELAKGNTEKAEDAIARALELSPDESRYHIIHARILAAADRLNAAENVLKKAVEMEPSVPNLKRLIGFYTTFGADDQGEAYLLSLIDQTEDAHELYMDLATFYTSRGNTQEAEKYILASVAKNPQSSEMYIYLGNFYRQTRAFDKAEEAFQKAVENAEDPASDEKAMLADFYFTSGKYEQAKQLADAVLEKNSGHILANFVRARLLIQEQKNTEALVILDKLIESRPRWGEAYYQKGIAHLNKGETRLSYRAAEQALQYAPNDPDAKTLMAHHFLLQREFSKAKNTAISALETAPGNLRAVIILGRSMIFSGETADAVKLFENVSEYTPDNIEVLFNKASAYVADNRVGEGIDTFREILRLNPDFMPALAALARVMIAQEKPDEAIATVRLQLKNAPDNPNYLMMLAGLLDNFGASPDSSDEALNLLEKAVEIAPYMPGIYSMRAGILMKQEKTDEAIENYKTMIEKSPNAIEGHMALGSLLEQTGDKAGAMKSYSRVLEIRPDFAPAANNLAWLKANSDKPDLGEALRLALIAKEAQPEDPYISDTLGFVHYKRGSYQLALTQFTKATEKRPDMPILRYHLALALHADGQSDQARRELKKALELEDGFSEYEAAKKLLAEIEETVR